MIHFALFGPLGIADAEGHDLRPKLLKSRAIMAILAATSGHRQSRSWLQSVLWQDRQQVQAKSSLRSSLADIRRHLGEYVSAFQTDHYEVWLDPSMISVAPNPAGSTKAADFLLGFDIPNAEGFEDWLRQKRSIFAQSPTTAMQTPSSSSVSNRIYLAASAQASMHISRMQCDALVDCIAKSAEDLDLAGIVDGRGKGCSIEEYRRDAAAAGCDLILIAESGESSVASINRLKILDRNTGSLVWSKSLVGDPVLDLEHPANVGVVAEFIETLTERIARNVDWSKTALTPEMMAVAGMNHIFKLGPDNFKTADMLLKRAHFERPSGCTLAWRAFLKTFLVAEQDFENPEAVIEEGLTMARHAIEAEPQNSMVLALSAHVEAMFRDDFEIAIDLAARSLTYNRCNPIAWACLGRAASFVGEFERGHALAQYGASLAKSTKYSFLIDSWASSTGLLAQDFASAKSYCETSHAKARSFAPPLRFLSALYTLDGQYDRAGIVVEKLREQEPGFALQNLRDEGYPSDTLKRAGVLNTIPNSEF